MQQICGQYRLGRSLGSGAFGGVFHAVHNENRFEVALKLSTGKQSIPHWKSEEVVYNSISSEPGFAVIHQFEEINDDTRFIAMELLGRNFHDMFNSLQKKFSLKTVLMFADQALQRLQYLHMKGFVHCDIKPDNFCVGLGPNSNQIYLIDFGLAKKYTVYQTDSADSKNPKSDKFEGTMRFASISAHQGNEILPKDDLESLAYTLVYMLNGKLPWSGINSNIKDRKRESIFALKRSLPPEEIAGNGLPEEFVKFLATVKNLRVGGIPDYAAYRQMFRNLFEQSGFIYDSRYDWVLQRSATSFNFPPPKQPPVKPVIPRARSDNPQPVALKQKEAMAKIMSPRVKPNAALSMLSAHHRPGLAVIKSSRK